MVQKLPKEDIAFGFIDPMYIEKYFTREFVDTFIGEGKKYRVVAYLVPLNTNEQKTSVVSSKTGEIAFVRSSSKRKA